MCARASDARGYERYALLGHSVGGKVAMVAALQRPESVEQLIVADIAPVSYPDAPPPRGRGDAAARSNGHPAPFPS
jgi:pimeloyl-ACP methyl ester carboxylesterase